MTHKLSIEAIKTLLIACHEAKRVVELQPPLPEGLTPGNLKVLDYIEYLERTAQPPKVSDIADLLQVTRPGITRLVSELQAINVIEKISDKQDKRIVRLRMTDEERKIHAYLLMCDKEAIEVQKILPFLSDTWPLCRIGRAVIRASQSCRQSCNKSQCPACGCRSHHSCTHAPQFSRSFPAREWGSVLQRQGACGQCP